MNMRLTCKFILLCSTSNSPRLQTPTKEAVKPGFKMVVTAFQDSTFIVPFCAYLLLNLDCTTKSPVHATFLYLFSDSFIARLSLSKSTPFPHKLLSLKYVSWRSLRFVCPRLDIFIAPQISLLSRSFPPKNEKKVFFKHFCVFVLSLIYIQVDLEHLHIDSKTSKFHNQRKPTPTFVFCFHLRDYIHLI